LQVFRQKQAIAAFLFKKTHFQRKFKLLHLFCKEDILPKKDTDEGTNEPKD